MTEETKHVLTLLYPRDHKGANDFLTGLLFGLQEIMKQSCFAEEAGEPQLIYRFQIEDFIRKIRFFKNGGQLE